MKILWISHFAPFPPKGGAMQRSYNMLKELSKAAEITLISFASVSKVTPYYDDYEEGIRAIESELGKICHQVHLVPHGKYNRKKNKIINGIKSLFDSAPYDIACLKNQRMFNAINRVVNQHFDVVHADTIGLWPYVEDLNIPIILNHHNIESAMLERRAKNSQFPLNIYFNNQAKKLAAIEEKACRKAKLNITCSTLDSHRLLEGSLNNSIPIPNGVDISYFSRKQEYKNSKQCNLIFVGGLEWYPNEEAMIYFSERVWPQLKTKLKSVSMTVVGRGKIKSLEALSQSDQNFNTTGFVDDARPLFENASIYICPIQDGGGTKLKILDALAMGVPIIAHPIACEGIDVIENHHVIFASTPEEYIEKIIELQENYQLRKALSDNGRKLIEDQYSYDIIGKKIKSIYLQDIK